MARTKEQIVTDTIPTYSTPALAYGAFSVEATRNIAEVLIETDLNWLVKMAPILMDMTRERVHIIDKKTDKQTAKTQGIFAPPVADGEDYVPTKPKEPVEIPGYYATYRDDTDSPLGIVKGRYTPVQNVEAFAWLQEIINDSDAEILTAGILRGGKRTFVCLDLGSFEVVPGDEIRKHLIILNSHDGTSNLVFRLLPFRTATQTFLSFQSGQFNESQYKIRHTAGARLEIKEIKRIWAMIQKGYVEIQEVLSFLAATEVTEKQFARIIDFTFGVSPQDRIALDSKPEDKMTPRWVKATTTIYDILEFSPGVAITKNSLLSLYYAIVTYYDWFRLARNEGEDETIKIENKIDGYDSKKKIEALEAIIRYHANHIVEIPLL